MKRDCAARFGTLTTFESLSNWKENMRVNSKGYLCKKWAAFI